MVEAAGIEPASGSIPPKRLHAYPGFWRFAQLSRSGRDRLGYPEWSLAFPVLRLPGTASLL